MQKIALIFFIFLSFVYGKNYEKIEFEGLVHLSELSALELTGLSVEKPVSESQINNAVKSLFEQGYFTDIWVMESGGVLTFHFKEKPVIASIDFKGSSETEKEEKFLPLVQMKKGDMFHEERVEKAKDRIIQSMRDEGYFDTVVETAVTQKEDKVEIVFEVNKGRNITIVSQTFDGAEHFDAGDLETDIANKESEFGGWFIGRNDGKLKLDQLQYDFHRLKNYYMKHGYLDAEISDPLLSVDFDHYSADIYYAIEEGTEYRVGAIDIKLVEGNVSFRDVAEDFKLKPGKVFDIERMRKDLQAVQDVVGDQGYAFAKVYPDIRKDKEKGIADIIYAVKPGKKVYINDVIISGNSRTLDRVIRREIFLAPGDLYSTVEMRESKNALGRLGFFKDVKVEEKRISEDKMDLIIKVEETHTASLTVGGGYGSLNGWTVNAAISDRNVFGSAMNVSVNFEKSELANRAEFSIFNPRVNDSDYSLGFSVFNNYVDYSSISTTNQYTSDTRGVSVRSGKRLGRYWNASVSLGYSYSDIRYDEDNVSFNYYLFSGKTTQISLSPYLKFDDTDDYFTPRSGVIFSQSMDVTGFGADQEYTASHTRFAYYVGLEDYLDFDMIFRHRLRASYVFADVEDYMKFPYTSRLTMGGIRTVRGYQSGSISPVERDANGDVVYSDDGDPTYLGGNQMVVSNLELNIPLVPSSGLRMSLFYDYGAIGQDNFDEARSSYGLSFDWITPMAPLQFVFGWAIDPKEYDETANFEFTMGQKF